MQICFNSESAEVFYSLPCSIQENIKIIQEKIEEIVKKFNPEAVATSGFRSPGYNLRLPGSKKNSLHIWGCARDYRKNSIKKIELPGLKTIVEKSCVHFEVKNV